MAADERAVITIDVDVKNLNRIQQVIADLEAVGIASEVNAAKFDGLVGAMNRHTGAMGKTSKASQKLYEKITVLDRVTMAFTKQARKMMYGVIAMSVEFAASALTLASVNAAFVIGKVVMKGYTLVMQGLAAGLAAVGAAAIAAAAAFDEYQTAQFAFRYQSDAVTTSLDKSSFAMRSLYKDTQLNIYGIKALSAAFAAVSKNSKFTGESQKMLQAFSDFAASSGDPTKGLQAAANAIGLIQKKQVGMYKNSKYMSQEAINAIKQINPALADLYKTGGGTGGLGNKDKFIEMLLSGELAEKAGVAGAAQNLAGTLFAQFKSYLANALVELSDVGKRVLNPVKEALHDIFTGLTRTFRRVSGDLVAFGQGPFLKSLVSLVNKLEDFAVHLFRKYLPTTEGFFTRMGQIFLQLKVWFKEVRDSLNEMRAGGSIVIKTFGGPILEIFKGIGRNARSLAGLAERNKDSFLKFGDALKNVVTQLFEMSAAFRNMFTQALPFITVVLKGVARIVNFIESLFNKIAQLGPVFAALGIGVSAMALKRGTRRGMRSAMRGLDTDSGAFYGYHQISAAEAARRNMTISPAGGPGPATGGTPLGGAMATAGSSIAAAMTTTLEPGLKSISSSSTSAASALREVSGAVKQFGTSLRNGFKGGRVDAFTGMPMTEPSRLPGQSRADYQRDITRWHMQNKGDDLRGLEYTGPLGMPSRRAKSDPYAYGGLPGPYMPMQKQRYIDQSRRERFDRNIEAIADKRAERLGYDTTGAHYQLEKQFNSRTSLDAAAQAQMTTRQRIASGWRSYGNKMTKAGNAMERFSNRIIPNFLWRGSGPITGAATAGGGGGGGGGGINVAHTGVLQPGSVRTMGLFPYLQRQAGRTVFGTGYQGRGVVAETKNMLKGNSATHAYQGSISQQLEQHIAAGGTQETFVPNRRAAFKAGLRTQFSGAGLLAAGAASAIASKKGTAEAQGALQTGAGLMSMNAGLGIGVAGLGTAATAKTKLGGMAAGAVGGAALGYKIGKALPLGPFSGLVGAGVGAVLGTTFGFVMAKRNQRKMSEDAANKINFAQLGELAGVAAQGAIAGNLDAARNKLKQQGTFLKQFKAAGTKEDRLNVLKQYSTGPNAILSGNQLDLAAGDNADDFIKQMEKNQKNQKGVTAAFDFFDRTMARLKQTTGMTSAEIQDLAMHKNVNLFDSTQKLSDITAQLGVGMVRTAKQIKDSFRDIRVAALGVFDRFAKGKEMKDALQGAFESIFYGNGTPQALADYMAKVGDYLDYKNPNSPLMNIVTMVKEFGVGGKFGKGAKFTTGTLAGKTLGSDALKLGAESTNQLVKESSMNVANAIGEQLLGTNVQGVNPEDLRNRLIGKTSGLLNTISVGNAAGATEEQKTAAKSAEAQMKAIEQLISNPASFQGLNAAEAQAKLEKYFPGLFGAPAAGETSAKNRGGMTGLTDIVEKEMKLTVDEEAIRKQFMDAVKAGFLDINNTPEWWNQAPTWWSYKFNTTTGKFEPEDTRSPRRGRIGDTGAPKALGATMAAHRSMDSMLTGKRSVTSSFRTTNLGSPSSDHAAGRAYDLTGQNLGQYASLAKSAGGFAEFHGAASSRHLHVVPALGRSGDTSSPVVVGATAAGGSYQGGDINITIVESKDARATAKEVAREIIAMQRNERRRM